MAAAGQVDAPDILPEFAVRDTTDAVGLVVIVKEILGTYGVRVLFHPPPMLIDAIELEHAEVDGVVAEFVGLDYALRESLSSDGAPPPLVGIGVQAPVGVGVLSQVLDAFQDLRMVVNRVGCGGRKALDGICILLCYLP